MKKVLRTVVLIVACAVFLFSGYKVYDILNSFSDNNKLKTELSQYKPTSDTAEPDKKNNKIIKLQGINKDVVGWVTIDDTNIDYPFTQSDDNDYYLRKTLKLEYFVGGTVFMDFRCDPEINSFNTILYGHRMPDGSMFSNIRKYRDESYFNSHLTGQLTTVDKKYKIDVFAFMIVKSSSDAYNVDIYSQENVDKHLKFISDNATWYREPSGGITAGDRIVTMSTCTFEFDSARAVLVGKLVQVY